MFIIFGTLLIISFIIHIRAIFLLAKTKKKKYFKLFFQSAFTNIIFCILIIIMLFLDESVSIEIDPAIIKLITSGFLFITTLGVKIKIIIKIYRRSKDPANYHLNYFGKKVLHSSVTSPVELLLFFAAMPFFLFAGAYFIAKLVDYCSN